MLSVRDDDRLQAAVLALKAADRDIRLAISQATRDQVGPLWAQAVQVNARTRTDQAVLARSARIKAGNPPQATAGTSTRRLKGGLVPAEHWAAFEFGGTYSKQTTYRRASRKGGTHSVTRHTQRQLPPRKATGRVALPAFAEIAPRAVSMWVGIIVKAYSQALEGRT